jgi:mannose-6-phosphate isomerase-like protein (cupin superfamily)
VSEIIKSSDKEALLKEVSSIIDENGFDVVDLDTDKPWGAFFRLAGDNAEKFIDTYFSDIKDQFSSFEDLSPKYLIVEPSQRLSWQYHFRRAEHWRVLSGDVGVKLSDDDNEPIEFTKLSEGELVQFPALKRHRLIGLDKWGVVVEIWQHTEQNNPSDESDIIRVADDYKR